MHASVHGTKIQKSFEECFPDYGTPEEIVQESQDAAKLMDRLAQENLSELERGSK